MQSKIHKHTVHDSALQSNPGSNPLQDIIHDPNDGLFKRMHKHMNINIDLIPVHIFQYQITIKRSDCKRN